MISRCCPACGSCPGQWPRCRQLNEIAAGGPRAQARITKAVNAARRRACAGIEARHGALPGIAVADKVIDGVTCIRLDATVTPAHSPVGDHVIEQGCCSSN